MTKSATIVNLLENLTEEQVALIGTFQQVQLTKLETNTPPVYEFYNTVEEAETEKTRWLSEGE